MPKTTETLVEASEPIQVQEITLDDFANRKSRRGLIEGIAAFCHVYQNEPKHTFDAWNSLFTQFMNSPAE